jgi:competence protein ComEC
LTPRSPPNVRITFAHGLGVALTLFLPTPLVVPSLIALAVLIWTSARPPLSGLPTALVLALSLGAFTGHAGLTRTQSDCRVRIADGATFDFVGWFEARPGRGSAPFQVDALEGVGRGTGVLSGCRVTVRAFTVGDADPPHTGQLIRGSANWRKSRYGSLNPERAGTLQISEWVSVDPGAEGPGSRPGPGRPARLRGSIEARITSLFGAQSPIVDAVLLAGRSGLDPDLRERFAASGTVHLLAISGFHVGVVSGILVLIVGRLGLPPRVSALISTLGVLAYVAFLGFPAAATRAALLLCGLMAARLRGSPVSRIGLLASVFTLLLLLDPLWLVDVGFQLSFAGALGLVLWSEPLRKRLGRVGLPRGVRDALAAGIAATLPTIPLVAFHFGRISLVGIPATVLVTPLFVLAIPWTLLALALDVVSHAAALFVAGAASGLYVGAIAIVSWIGSRPGVAPPASNAVVVALTLVPVMGVLGLRRVGRVRLRVRWGVWAFAIAAGVLAAPVVGDLSRLGLLEIVVLDVGQGDAIVIRTPKGRWILVDAGPAGLGQDAGAEVVLPFLKRRGVRRLDRVYFTHPDLDHTGGGVSVLGAMDVGLVSDPGLPAGKRSYLELLETAQGRGVPWERAVPGTTWSVDGVTLRVLAPLRPELTGGTGGNDTDANAASVVLALDYGRFRMLLPGDAPDDVEEALLRLGVLGDVDVLKVGHHGSTTSTSWALLERIRPELALISVGRRNRYGHPAPSVLARLDRIGARIERTDQSGTLRVLARDDGRWTVDAGRIR